MIEMLLMLVVMVLLGVACAAVSWRMLNSEDPAVERTALEAKPRPAAAEARFFLEPMPVPRPRPPRVPVEALLLQIEHHIRLEQAAAESFLDCPTPQSLHRRTPSPLMH